MTNSFFQTCVKPEHIKYTAITTPFGLYEWTLMLQGCWNTLSTHQHCMYNTLRPYIGSICHVYLDDIIIWSQDLDKHCCNVKTILNALSVNHLSCLLKKTDLFCTDLMFLGHRILHDGVSPNGSKVEKIYQWLTPWSAHDVHSFLGLVRYISSFLPKLVQYTAILNPLTSKDADTSFVWEAKHNLAFDSIKLLVLFHECLTTIDHSNMGNNRIFVSMDASDFCTGAVLSYSTSLATTHPVAFESAQLSGAELKYPVHEKELPTIVHTLKKWHVDLLGVPFMAFTDHRTLENFTHQKHLFWRQAHWQEFLGQYNFSITYLKGVDNCVADTLSRLLLVEPLPPTPRAPPCNTALSVPALCFLRRTCRSLVRCPVAVSPVASSHVLSVASNLDWVACICLGYPANCWILQLLCSLHLGSDPLDALISGSLDGCHVSGISVQDRLLFVGDRLCIPRVLSSTSHCSACAMTQWGTLVQTNPMTSSVTLPTGRTRDTTWKNCISLDATNVNETSHRPTALHPLPVPDGQCLSATINFVGPLPVDAGFDYIATFTCGLSSDIHIIPCRSDLTAEGFAELFFVHWYCKNGLPADIISNHNKLFMSHFWKALHHLTTVNLKMSTSFHPETDSTSECTNKMVIQMLQFHVERNQHSWSRTLPLICFQLMNTTNTLTGFTPFQLCHGANSHILPPTFCADTDAFLSSFAEEGKLS